MFNKAVNSICYFYIFDYRSIHNLGISLDAQYTYEIDKEKKVLTIRENESYIKGFWPKGISALAALVGNNGAGKTTFMEAMLDIFADGNNDGDFNALIVFRISDVLHIFQPSGSDFRVEGVKVHRATEAPKIGLFYYSAYFRPSRSVHSPGDGELAGVYNATDTWHLIDDLTKYSNIDGMYRSERLRDYLDSLERLNNNRVAQLITDRELRKYLPENAIPPYILIVSNESGYKNWLRDKQNRVSGGLQLGTQFWGHGKEDILAGIAYAHFHNIPGVTVNGVNIVEAAQQEFAVEFHQSNSNTVSALKKTLQKYPALTSQMEDIIEVIDFLANVCSYNQTTGALYIKVKDPKKSDDIDKLIAYFQSNAFLVAHYFDMVPSREPAYGTQLSSGEMDMLKLFSRLLDAIRLFPQKFANIECPQIILLDEAETSYHPEWQRQFVKMLLGFLQAFYKKDNGVHEFQVVLSTHSPILLSDIPRMCTNYLKKDKDTGEVKVFANHSETFGANVFDLYRDSFFMEDGLVGTFACEKIEKLYHEIKEGNNSYKKQHKKVEMIGDERIRGYLLSLLEKDNKQMLIDYYQGLIDELREEEHEAD